ncbi:MAG: hypothetical protein CMO44_18565 [Verrucomicrobiales bacterium]|nr:hypothetical protein [Verrucomicrobiales bacterium]
MTNILDRFDQFLKINLNHKENDVPLFEMFQEFTKLKWNKDNTLLVNPDAIPEKAAQFLKIMDESENTVLKWFVVNRQVGLSDPNFQRAINQYKSRFLYTNLSNLKLDLGIVDYLQRINTNQLQLRLPQPKPIISMHTARLMRELYILKRNKATKYKLKSDTEQVKNILKIWFEQNYTLNGEGIGYARRQLLEEANDFLVSKFGDCKIVYCHDPAWVWLMQEVIKTNDKGQRGMYLRLPIWKKGQNGKAILNKRKNISTAGEFTLEKRQKQRLQHRKPNKRERDAARKARAKKQKMATETL